LLEENAEGEDRMGQWRFRTDKQSTRSNSAMARRRRRRRWPREFECVEKDAVLVPHLYAREKALYRRHRRCIISPFLPPPSAIRRRRRRSRSVLAKGEISPATTSCWYRLGGAWVCNAFIGCNIHVSTDREFASFGRLAPHSISPLALSHSLFSPFMCMWLFKRRELLPLTNDCPLSFKYHFRRLVFGPQLFPKQPARRFSRFFGEIAADSRSR